jgi:hypothetical protein
MGKYTKDFGNLLGADLVKSKNDPTNKGDLVPVLVPVHTQKGVSMQISHKKRGEIKKGEKELTEGHVVSDRKKRKHTIVKNQGWKDRKRTTGHRFQIKDHETGRVKGIYSHNLEDFHGHIDDFVGGDEVSVEQGYEMPKKAKEFIERLEDRYGEDSPQAEGAKQFYSKERHIQSPEDMKDALGEIGIPILTKEEQNELQRKCKGVKFIAGRDESADDFKTAYEESVKAERGGNFFNFLLSEHLHYVKPGKEEGKKEEFDNNFFDFMEVKGKSNLANLERQKEVAQSLVKNFGQSSWKSKEAEAKEIFEEKKHNLDGRYASPSFKQKLLHTFNFLLCMGVEKRHLQDLSFKAHPNSTRASFNSFEKTVNLPSNGDMGIMAHEILHNQEYKEQKIISLNKQALASLTSEKTGKLKPKRIYNFKGSDPREVGKDPKNSLMDKYVLKTYPNNIATEITTMAASYLLDSNKHKESMALLSTPQGANYIKYALAVVSGNMVTASKYIKEMESYKA